MSGAVKVENLAKIYRLGEIGTGTLSYDIQRWVARMRGKEDPYLKIGEVNDKSKKGGNIIYSLQDINFEIVQGKAVGIIGRNGAGKSTLLKILSRITSPTTGRVKLKGRVASLLEVGTGFHPELTGKENIYLNGAILGMSKREIDRKLDEIIAFSGIERYIDTPVKRYSSGMYVRLAFAVAAHLESEILIVDEVLAVGDMEFQQKCLGKMGEVSKSEGRTVLFVSHNLSAIKTLCEQGLVLSDGKLIENSGVEQAIVAYKKLLDKKIDQSFSVLEKHVSDKIIMSASVELNGEQPYMQLQVDMVLNLAKAQKGPILVIDILNSEGVCLFQSISSLNEFCELSEPADITAMIQVHGIVPDMYTSNIYVCNGIFENIDYVKDMLHFEIIDSPIREKLNFNYKGTENGFIYPITSIVKNN